MAQMLAGLAAAQTLQATIALMQAEMRRAFAALREEMTRRETVEDLDPWLDAKTAAKYMGVSAGTFDKYRYLTEPKLNGCKLDGKTLYKRSEIDKFVRLYELKSNGRA